MMFTDEEFIVKISNIDPIKRENESSTYHLKYSKTHSRNTKIYCFDVEGQTYIAKLNATMSTSELITEFQQYKSLQDLFKPFKVRSLIPIAFVKEMGVIITREEKGDTLQDLLLKICNDTNNERNFRDISLAVEKSAYALYAFHRVHNENFPIEKRSKSYLDFSPSNIILREDEIVLLDLPEKNETKDVYFDIGVFCFEISRAFLKNKKWMGKEISISNNLKYRFLQRYHQLCGNEFNSDVLNKVQENEILRIKKVISYYKSFYKYDDYIKQFMRYILIVPVILVYSKLILPKGYEEIKNLL